MVCGKYFFEIVAEFKYLGLHYNQSASEQFMISKIMDKARKCFAWLVAFVNSNGWKCPNLRLVLFDVYVRSILQYGVNVWGPRLLLCGTEHAYI